jgi:hypothetical protein
MTVLVGDGIVYVPNSSYDQFDATSTKFWRVVIDGESAKSISANASGNTRIDLICVKVNKIVVPNEYASNVATLVVVEGIGGAGTPATPSNHYVLATVSVADGATSITNANITDQRDQLAVNSDMAPTPDLSGYVTLSADETITGAKTFDKALGMKHIATPSNPASGYKKVYFKSDGKLYKLDSSGVETEVGAGSGSVATDTIWDAKGDLAVGTGADTATKLSTATNGKILATASGEATGLKWVDALATTAKARAYRATTAQSIPDSTFTKVQLNAESYDPGNNFDSTTNYRFTAPVAGYYLISAATIFSGAIADKRYIMRIYKNGATILTESQEQSSISDDISVTALDLVLLAASDTIEVQVYHTSGVAKNLSNNEAHTFLTCHLMSI